MKAQHHNDENFLRAVADLESAKDFIVRSTEELPKLLEGLVGPSLRAMLRSKHCTLMALSHEIPEHRIAALLLLANEWDLPDGDFLQKCEELALHDPDARVRGLAWDVLRFFPKRIESDTARRLVDRLISNSTFSNDAEKLRSVQQELVECEEDLRALGMEMEQTQQTNLERLAGPLANKIAADYEFAEACLRHRDASVRAAAVSAIANQWRRSSRFGREWINAMSDERDVQVRLELLCGIIKAFERTEDVPCCKLLATLVASDNEPLELRLIAYDGLYQVSNAAVSVRPSPETFLADLSRFPANVDWTFVRSFLKAGSRSESEQGH